jgi:L-ascorbate metabolism protein UlaG (beta-lactamase superfamily)
MEIYYLENSAFALFLEDALLVFDYYNDAPVNGTRDVLSGVIGEADLLKKKKVFVFASHSHGDHFHPVIFKWQQTNPDTTYFLDFGIKKRLHQPLEHVFFMQKGNVVEENGLRVQAFGSTDEGISFYIETEGLRIFHAGDLNFWHWREGSDEAYAKEAGRFFLAEMADIVQGISGLDLAFFPVDPIMGTSYDEGAVFFAEAMQPGLFIPMHCRGSMDAYEDFKQKMQDKTKVVTYRKRGEKLSLI